MVLIEGIKPLSTVLIRAVNKSQQHQEKNSWERQESNLELPDGKRNYHLFAMLPRNKVTHSIVQK